MTCDEARAIITAARDNEPNVYELDSAEAHASSCSACRAWLEESARIDRLLTLTPLGNLDHTATALRAWEEEFRPESKEVARLNRATASSMVRIGLGIAALQSLWLVSLDILSFLNGSIESRHLAGEVAAFNITVATIFLISALDGRIEGRLLAVSIATALLVAVGVADLVQGVTSMPRELLRHAPTLGGLVLMILSKIITEDGPAPDTQALPPVPREDKDRKAA